MSSGAATKKGPPKHKNKFAWNPNANRTINPTELGGQLRPFSESTGICLRCREQIEWKRKYGKYKPITEPTKCQRCTKRNVRQAYHMLCTGCAKEHNVCAKCSSPAARIVGRDIAEVEAEKKMLEEAIRNARERERRSLIRAMNKGKLQGSAPNTADDDIKADEESELNKDEGNTELNNDDEANSSDEDEPLLNKDDEGNTKQNNDNEDNSSDEDEP